MWRLLPGAVLVNIQGWREPVISGVGRRCVHENHGKRDRLPGLLLWPAGFQQHLWKHCILEAKTAGIDQQWDCQGCFSS